MFIEAVVCYITRKIGQRNIGDSELHAFAWKSRTRTWSLRAINRLIIILKNYSIFILYY